MYIRTFTDLENLVALEGVSFEMTDADGTVVDSWTQESVEYTDLKGTISYTYAEHALTIPTTGYYEIHETSVPDGYKGHDAITLLVFHNPEQEADYHDGLEEITGPDGELYSYYSINSDADSGDGEWDYVEVIVYTENETEDGSYYKAFIRIADGVSAAELLDSGTMLSTTNCYSIAVTYDEIRKYLDKEGLKALLTRLSKMYGSLGGSSASGVTYTAGEGIAIEDGVISLDSDAVKDIIASYLG